MSRSIVTFVVSALGDGEVVVVVFGEVLEYLHVVFAVLVEPHAVLVDLVHVDGLFHFHLEYLVDVLVDDLVQEQDDLLYVHVDVLADGVHYREVRPRGFVLEVHFRLFGCLHPVFGQRG